MRAFILYLNRKRVATAGVGDQGVLAANITWVGRKTQPFLSTRTVVVEEELGLALGGLNTATDEHLRWRQRPLRVGDEVRIKIVEAKSVDRPRHRQRRNRTQEVRQQKTYVRQLAKRFGWKIQTPR